MHRVLRDEVFDGGSPPVVAERLTLDHDVSAHGHAFMELAVVLDGAATHVSSAGAEPLRRGSSLVLRPGEWHRYLDVARLSVLNLYVGPELFARELAWIVQDPRLAVLLWRARGGHTSGRRELRIRDDAVTRIESWCEALGASEPSASDRMSRLGHLTLVLGEVAGVALDSEAESRPTRAHPGVVRVTHLVQEDLAEAWSVPRLAQEVNLAPAYLVRLFTRDLGLPPIAYLNRLRAERASGLLIESDLPVASIGAMVGWADPSYASRRFRACFGVSPAKYRAAFRPRA